ncbi:MAG: MFS transporter [Clostridia bacterium]|nr:MFS transporter [Clostridia bacterium]
MNNWKTRFFTIWTGQAFSLLGSSLVDFALIWWLTETTGSERILAFSSLLTLLPRMILGPFAGSVIDRLNRKTVMILADGAIALVTVALILLFHFRAESVALVLLVLLLRSLGSMFHQPAMKSATALLVPEQHLARIGGINRILTGAMNIVAPVAGAMLISAFDVKAVLLIDVVTALIAVGTLFFSSVPDPRVSTAQKSASIRRETLEGLRYVLNTRSLIFVVGTCTLANFCIGPTEAFKSLMVTSVFGGGVMELSWITAACGLGLVSGGVIMGLWGGCKRNLVTSGIGWGGVGVCYAAIFFLPVTNIWWLVAALYIANIFMAIGCAGLDAFYETKVPQEYHGRVFSVISTIDNTTIPIGLLVAAIFGELVPIRLWYLITGKLHVGLFLFWMGSRELKRAEETPSEAA